jgi:hypothetical protein
MTHPYGEYVYSTRGLLSRGFMGRCEKNLSLAKLQFVRAFNAAAHPTHTLYFASPWDSGSA